MCQRKKERGERHRDTTESTFRCEIVVSTRLLRTERCRETAGMALVQTGPVVPLTLSFVGSPVAVEQGDSTCQGYTRKCGERF